MSETLYLLANTITYPVLLWPIFELWDSWAYLKQDKESTQEFSKQD